MSGEAELKALLEVINRSANQAIGEYKKGGNDVPTIHSKTHHPIDFAIDTIALKKAVRLLEGACQQLCASLAPPQHTVQNYIVSFEWACVDIVTRAKVADVLEKYPNGLHVDELAKLVNLEKGKLARVLRLLATKGCFTEVSPNIFANNRISLVTVSSSHTGALCRLEVEGFSQGAVAMYETMMEPECAASDQQEMAPLIRTLRKKGLKGNRFDILKDTKQRENFDRAMIGVSYVAGLLSVLHYYPWNEVKTFCDVGSSIGAVSRPLSKAHPHLKITNQDLPEVLALAKDAWAKDAPEALEYNRVEFVPFNFLEERPAPCQDVYYLRGIIHNWPDAKAVIIMQNIRKAMAPHSRLLIHDYAVTPASRDSNTSLSGLAVAPAPLLPNFGNGSIRMYQQDLNMWMRHNAKERTVDEYIGLGSAVGLRLEKVYDLGETAVLEFRVAA